MITKYSEVPDHVAAFRASGEVTAKDYEEVLVPLVEEKLSHHKKISLLYSLGPEFKRFTAGAMWDDTKVGLKHIANWEKIAMVTDVPWLRNTVQCLGFVMPAKVKVFHDAEFEQAKEWVASHN
ncbi:MAG TPA: STAS/SEC14 domain-containing protein [Oceanipulchritudo sp.]|nr:STAS/SEC14 domain-containing protein [Oceanipulchritudo sp.]